VVTRTLVNTGDPLVDPGGDPIANAVFTFTLVDEAKRQPIALFDSAEEGGELIRGDAETATTNEVGLFTVDLWPNDRGEVATLYKVMLTGVVKPFYIRVASGEGDLTLIAAKTAYEATSAQTLSLFDALLAQILATVAAIGEVATTIANGLMSYTDKVKLDGIAIGANNYTHPANHAPAIISQDVDNRFVTDTEKATWNAKAPAVYDANAYNVEIGDGALQSNVSGAFCVAVGANTLLANTDGYSNTGVGYYSLAACIDGVTNAALGNHSGAAITSGSSNTAVGSGSLGQCTTGGTNTAVGRQALTGLITYSNCSGIGYLSAVTGSNQIQLGNSSTTVYAFGAVQDRSDIRDKADVEDTQLGLDFLNRLRPVAFRWDYREDYFDMVDGVRVPVPKDGSRKRSRFHQGFIAQEVKQVTTELGTDFGGYQDHSVNGGEDVLTLGYEEFIAPMVKAIQELNAEIQMLKNGGN
jgi:hypothetical protein